MNNSSKEEISVGSVTLSIESKVEVSNIGMKVKVEREEDELGEIGNALESRGKERTSCSTSDVAEKPQSDSSDLGSGGGESKHREEVDNVRNVRTEEEVDNVRNVRTEEEVDNVRRVGDISSADTRGPKEVNTDIWGEEEIGSPGRRDSVSSKNPGSPPPSHRGSKWKCREGADNEYIRREE